jgi:hypothetical protein
LLMAVHKAEFTKCIAVLEKPLWVLLKHG